MSATIRPFLIAITLLIVGGCASSGFTKVKPTPLDRAQIEIPEDELLDVGVALAEVPPLTTKEQDKQGTNEDIRRSERVFIPFQLKNTLTDSSYWGAVQVVPAEVSNVDLLVKSEVVKSNGEIMQIKVEAVDAIGRPWLERKYQAKVTDQHYIGIAPGRSDAFQNLYNTVANELAEFKRSLTAEEIQEIRTVSELRFAEEFAPDAFGEYLVTVGDGRVSVQRMPADDDPLMARIAKIREREYMFIDTMNEYFEGFYTNMWDAYENWRKYNLAETVAMRKVKEEAFIRTLTGALMIAAAVALDVGNVGNTSALSNILVLGGGAIVVDGINVSQQAKIHSAAIEELAESFGSEMRPTVVELEGKQYELTGTAEEQYTRMKNLLREIYYEETGFGAPPDTVPDASSGDADAVDP